MSSKAWLWVVLFVLASCVDAREPASQGSSSFIGGPQSGSFDYGTGGAGAIGSTGTGSIGGAAGATMLPTAGMVSEPVATGGVGSAGGMMIDVSGSGGTGGSAGDGSAAIGGSAGDTPTGGTAAAGTGGSSAGMLTIKFTSGGNDGEYAPRNVGAVWIETGSGTFVKTIKRWAGVRAGHLTRWTQASGGWGGGFFFFAIGGGSADELDAVTAATLRTHETHDLTWDMQDPNGMLVPDGSYRIVFEVTESERVQSVVAEVEFEKGASPVTLSPPDQGPYSGLTVTYTP